MHNILFELSESSGCLEEGLVDLEELGLHLVRSSRVGLRQQEWQWRPLVQEQQVLTADEVLRGQRSTRYAYVRLMFCFMCMHTML